MMGPRAAPVQAGIVEAGPDVVLEKGIAADRAKGAVESQKSQLEEWKKKLEEIDKWFKEKSGALQGSAAGAAKISEMEKERRLAQGEISSREQTSLPAAEVKAKSATAELEAAERKIEEAAKRKTELDREIAKLESDLKRDDSLRGEEGKANRRRRAAEGEEATWEKIMKSPEGKALKEGADLEAIKESGGKLTVQQSSQLASVNSLLESVGMNGKASLHVLAVLHNHAQDQGRQIMEMAKRIDAFSKQMRNQASPP